MNIEFFIPKHNRNWKLDFFDVPGFMIEKTVTLINKIIAIDKDVEFNSIQVLDLGEPNTKLIVSYDSTEEYSQQIDSLIEQFNQDWTK